MSELFSRLSGGEAMLICVVTVIAAASCVHAIAGAFGRRGPGKGDGDE